ncbi:MAG: transglycosylase SLT domain-containing protein [Steroidobacteraceae bacterium]
MSVIATALLTVPWFVATPAPAAQTPESASERTTGAVAVTVPRKRARLPRVLARDFYQHADARLPVLEPYFRAAGAATNLDWKLLASLAYQESRWLPRARSPQGAVGVMMLMPDTAKQMHVKDRLSARENILGGARYLAWLKQKIPQRIRDPDRTWLALAAYNIGLGHLENARIVAQMRGLNPDRWKDVRSSLPLLSDPKWHTRFPLGYARGEETAELVERTFQFAAVLESIELVAAESSATTRREEPAQ